MTSGIYGIKNKENHKMYVGSSGRIESRQNDHRRSLRKGTHPNTHLQAAWNKYGEDAFEFLIIQECRRKTEVLVKLEQFWIDSYDAYHNGYNQRPIANSPKGLPVSPKLMTYLKSSKHAATMSALKKGVPLSENHRAAIGLSLLGHTYSDKTKRLMSKSAKERVTQDQIDRFTAMAYARKGTKMSAKGCANISAVLRRRPPISETTREKLRQAAKNRDPEVRAAALARLIAGRRAMTRGPRSPQSPT